MLCLTNRYIAHSSHSLTYLFETKSVWGHCLILDSVSGLTKGKERGGGSEKGAEVFYLTYFLRLVITGEELLPCHCMVSAVQRINLCYQNESTQAVLGR